MIAVDIASGYVVLQNLQAKVSGLYGGSLRQVRAWVGPCGRAVGQRMRMRAIPQRVRGIMVEDDEDIARVIDVLVAVKAAKPLNGGGCLRIVHNFLFYLII